MSTHHSNSMDHTKTKDKLREIADTASEAATNASEVVTAKLKNVGVNTDQIVDTAKEGAVNLSDMIFTEIRKRPFQALAAAALFGMWFGFRRG